MNLENYVSTLEQSQKLDKLLGKRESIFCWVYGIEGALIYSDGFALPAWKGVVSAP